jgi:tetratricopeptide (TPR) repeat protein/lipid-A-disaccharide synthase-like uncharacterized protein
VLKLILKKIWPPCLIIFLGVIIYYNTLNNSFHFDDRAIFDVDAIMTFRLAEIFRFFPTRFIGYLTFAVNYHLGGRNVLGYHVFNILTHIGSAILVWWFIKLIYSALKKGKKSIPRHPDLVALFGALIFLSHPIQTGAVTYIYQRSASLAAFFYIFSVCLYLKTRVSQLEGASRLKWLSSYVLSFLFCLMSMFTKENAVTLPLAIVLVEFCFFKGEGRFKKIYVMPFVIALLIIPGLFFYYKATPTAVSLQVMADTPVSSLHYLLTECRVMITYLRLLIIPINQNLDYDYPVTGSIMHIPTIISILVIIAFILAAFKLYNKHRLISFSIFWFFLTLLPESTVIPLSDVIFEHRLYLPMAGYCIFLTVLVYYFLGRKSITAMVIILALLVNWYAILTYTRNLDWRDNLTLWGDTIRKSPGKARPYFNRGVAQQENKKALEDLDKALTLYYQQINEKNDYSEDYDKLLKSDHGYAKAFNFLGVKFVEINLVAHATDLFKRAIKIDPSNIQYYTNLCAAYGELNKFKEAIEVADKAIEMYPNSAATHYNLSVVYYLNNQHDLAIKHLEIATQLGFSADPEFVAKLKKAR